MDRSKGSAAQAPFDWYVMIYVCRVLAVSFISSTATFEQEGKPLQNDDEAEP